MFKRLDSASLDTSENELSTRFYKARGRIEVTRSVRADLRGGEVTLITLRFLDGGSDLLVRDEREVAVTEMEIAAEDVPATFAHLIQRYPGARWIREPFSTPEGSVAVVEVPGQTVLVLLGKVA